MKSTAAFTSASGSEVLPPLGGIVPFLPVKPLSACVYSVFLPCAMRGPQSALSPTFGAPAMPAAWHIAQVVLNTVWPLLGAPMAEPSLLLPLEPPALLLATVVSLLPAGAAAEFVPDVAGVLLVDGAAELLAVWSVVLLEVSAAAVLGDAEDDVDESVLLAVVSLWRPQAVSAAAMAATSRSFCMVSLPFRFKLGF
jgi:hypothetical protein